MRYIFTLLTLSLLLMGQTCQERARAVFIATCNGLDQAYEYYDEVAASGVLSQQRINQVAFFRAESDKACANTNATPQQLARVAANAYAALNAAFREGGELNSARMGYAKITDLKRLVDQARRQ